MSEDFLQCLPERKLDNETEERDQRLVPAIWPFGPGDDNGDTERNESETGS
jgi:hypothetical protein